MQCYLRIFISFKQRIESVSAVDTDQIRKGIQPVKSLAPAIHSRSFFEDLFQLTLHMGLTTVQCYRAACDYLLQPRKLFEQSTVEARSKARGLQGESQEIGRA